MNLFCKKKKRGGGVIPRSLPPAAGTQELVSKKHHLWLKKLKLLPHLSGPPAGPPLQKSSAGSGAAEVVFGTIVRHPLRARTPE